MRDCPRRRRGGDFPGRREEKEEKRGECERTRSSAFLRCYVAGRKLCRAGDRLVAKVHFLESRLASERARSDATGRRALTWREGHPPLVLASLRESLSPSALGECTQ